MIENFAFSVNVVLPIFIILILGNVIKRLGFLDDATIKKMNTLVFTFALPVSLFKDISRSDFSSIFDIRLIGFAVATTLLAFFVSWAIAAFFMPDKKSLGAFVQGAFRGNYAIIGLPLIANIMGSRLEGKGSLITTFVVPIYNILSVVILSISSAKVKDTKTLVKNAAIGIIKNPLIIGVLVGIPFSLFRVKFPTFINTSINYMSSLTTPLALLAIGATLDISKIKGKMKWSAISAAFKLIITPCVFLPIAILLGFRGEELVVLFVMYATPTAISSFIMADSMGNDGMMAANIILLTTTFSIFTFTIGIFLLRSFGLI